jgi:hypothetical protein
VRAFEAGSFEANPLNGSFRMNALDGSQVQCRSGRQVADLVDIL